MFNGPDLRLTFVYFKCNFDTIQRRTKTCNTDSPNKQNGCIGTAAVIKCCVPNKISRKEWFKMIKSAFGNNVMKKMKFKRIVGKPNCSDKFNKIIKRYKKKLDTTLVYCVRISYSF